MYSGKASLLAKKRQEEEKAKRGKELIAQKTERLLTIYSNFQKNLSQFASRYKDEINNDANFRNKFNMMCQELGVDPMLSKKTIWTQLGFGDFYHHLAMKILDICAKKRHINGGIMKINLVIEDYHKIYKDKISKNDVVKALEKTNSLGNLSIIRNQYVCTVPLELNDTLSELMSLAEKYGFISAKLLKKVKNWDEENFNLRLEPLRKQGVVWIDRKTASGAPHFYFTSHMPEFDVNIFKQFMNQY